jgi:serine/threonine protein kinase
MPSHIHIVIVHRPSEPSKELIAKKVRKESNELATLKRLNTIQPRSEHVISLLDSFHGQSGPWVILPKMGSVTNFIVVAPEQPETKVIQVCWGLIKGLAYLHELCIAHRDIKPDNLVVDQDFCLKIIDFDIAMQLRDEDDEVDDECGTMYWIAPEVENKSSTYNPIKADRWSCGRVLLYLLDKFKTDDEQLRVIGRKLKVHNPNQRPSLLECRSWLCRSWTWATPRGRPLDLDRTRWKSTDRGPEREEAETHVIKSPDLRLCRCRCRCRKVQSLGSNSGSDL